MTSVTGFTWCHVGESPPGERSTGRLRGGVPGDSGFLPVQVGSLGAWVTGGTSGLRYPRSTTGFSVVDTDRLGGDVTVPRFCCPPLQSLVPGSVRPPTVEVAEGTPVRPGLITKVNKIITLSVCGGEGRQDVTCRTPVARVGLTAEPVNVSLPSMVRRVSVRESRAVPCVDGQVPFRVGFPQRREESARDEVHTTPRGTSLSSQCPP